MYLLGTFLIMTVVRAVGSPLRASATLNRNCARQHSHLPSALCSWVREGPGVTVNHKTLS